jgi:hypothetical protein
LSYLHDMQQHQSYARRFCIDQCLRHQIGIENFTPRQYGKCWMSLALSPKCTLDMESATFRLTLSRASARLFSSLQVLQPQSSGLGKHLLHFSPPRTHLLINRFWLATSTLPEINYLAQVFSAPCQRADHVNHSLVALILVLNESRYTPRHSLPPNFQACHLGDAWPSGTTLFLIKSQ